MLKSEKALRKKLSREAVRVKAVEDKLDGVEKAKEYPLDVFRRRNASSGQNPLPENRQNLSGLAPPSPWQP